MIFLAGAIGVALLVALMLWYGIPDIAAAVASTRWGLALVVVARIVQMIAAGLAWRVLLPKGIIPPPAIFVLLRWIRGRKNESATASSLEAAQEEPRGLSNTDS